MRNRPVGPASPDRFWKASDANKDLLTAEVRFRAEDETVWRILGEEEKRRGNWDEAINAYRQILGVESGNIRAQVDIADIFMQQRMIEEDRECKDILQQLAAVRSAAHQATVTLVRNYAAQCVVSEGSPEEIADALEMAVSRLA